MKLAKLFHGADKVFRIMHGTVVKWGYAFVRGIARATGHSTSSVIGELWELPRTVSNRLYVPQSTSATMRGDHLEVL